MRTTNIIANEYSMSTSSIKCRVENHFLRENCLNIMNQAELKAMKEEQIRFEEERKL